MVDIRIYICAILILGIDGNLDIEMAMALKQFDSEDSFLI